MLDQAFIILKINRISFKVSVYIIENLISVFILEIALFYTKKAIINYTKKKKTL